MLATLRQWTGDALEDWLKRRKDRAWPVRVTFADSLGESVEFVIPLPGDPCPQLNEVERRIMLAVGEGTFPGKIIAARLDMPHNATVRGPLSRLTHQLRKLERVKGGYRATGR
jgi:hypothetical protein